MKKLVCDGCGQEATLGSAHNILASTFTVSDGEVLSADLCSSCRSGIRESFGADGELRVPAFMQRDPQDSFDRAGAEIQP